MVKKSNSTSSGREEALASALAGIDKDYGEGSIMRLGDRPKHQVEGFSTGSIELDLATGTGGFPRGRISEIYAQEAVGKTTLTLHAIADCQRKGGVAAFIDAEHALDPRYAKHLGVDTKSLLISQPDSGEQALEIADRLVASGAVDLIVIDSVAALVPRAELEGQMGDHHVGLQARLMSQALRKITGKINQTNTALIFINQFREKIGTVGYGDNKTTSGGNALKFYASLRIRMTRIGSKKDGADPITNTIKAKIDKNKFAPPFKVVEFENYLGDGISRASQILMLGDKEGIVKKGGAYYKTADGETTLGQGFVNAIKFLEDNPEFRDSLWDQLVQSLTDKVTSRYDDDEDEDGNSAEDES